MMNCCPKYFFNQERLPIDIPPGSPGVEIIQVSVTTVLPNERVRLDSMAYTSISTVGEGERYGYQLVYDLFRDTTVISEISLTHTNQVKQELTTAPFIEDTPNITWTDVPGLPGTYIYRIIVQRLGTEENIADVTVFDRSIDAIVFPPVNP
ncbi:hypothetical protein [Bacillus suaedaesalsae]|uniref:Uncharacterized protein n=1 Tax=Bacillus suaedaesalsae TaxID=2810349 RepID=A0ABS2DJZ8_9BACI|nr:hypothetical protein [Bacillus suaedaesalsae]MBM6617803.1 hypothetical protein [Bacillus suaedaesalsae]